MHRDNRTIKTVAKKVALNDFTLSFQSPPTLTNRNVKHFCRQMQKSEMHIQNNNSCVCIHKYTHKLVHTQVLAVFHDISEAERTSSKVTGLVFRLDSNDLVSPQLFLPLHDEQQQNPKKEKDMQKFLIYTDGRIQHRLLTLFS